MDRSAVSARVSMLAAEIRSLSMFAEDLADRLSGDVYLLETGQRHVDWALFDLQGYASRGVGEIRESLLTIENIVDSIRNRS